MILLAAAVLPRGRAPLTGPLLSLTIFAVLLGTIGGFGSIFNLLVSPEVRAYNRISLFIALFAIITVVHQIDRLVKRDIARWPVFVLLAAFGVWDQSPRPWFRPQIAAGRERVAARYHADAAFFRGVEQAMPGASLFTLPYVRYPEDYDTPLPGGYEHARGYLHTRTLRFSFGAIRRREADQWARATSAQPPRELIRRLALRGFDGIFLDRRGFAPGQAAEFVAAVGAAAAVAVPTIDHPDGNQSVLDLRPYRERLRLELGAEFDTLRRRDEDAVRVLWLSGFRDDEESERRRHRWCDARGEVALVNPTDRPRRVQLTMAFGTGTPESSDLTIEGGVWSDRFPVSSTPVPKRWDLVVPPGRHRVAFRCRPGGTDRPGAVPGQVFFVALFEIVEAPEREGS